MEALYTLNSLPVVSFNQGLFLSGSLLLPVFHPAFFYNQAFSLFSSTAITVILIQRIKVSIIVSTIRVN